MTIQTLVARSRLPLIVVISTGLLLVATPMSGQTPTLSIPPDSPRWDLQEQAKPAEYQGRRCLLLDGGAAILKDFELRDGVIDVDVATLRSTVSSVFSFGSTKTVPTANGCSSACTSPDCPTP
jgi:hypothetical protein